MTSTSTPSDITPTEAQLSNPLDEVRPPPITTAYSFPSDLLDGEGTPPERLHLSNVASRQGPAPSEVYTPQLSVHLPYTPQLNIHLPDFGDHKPALGVSPTSSPCTPCGLMESVSCLNLPPLSTIDGPALGGGPCTPTG